MTRWRRRIEIVATVFGFQVLALGRTTPAVPGDPGPAAKRVYQRDASGVGEIAFSSPGVGSESRSRPRLTDQEGRSARRPFVFRDGNSALVEVPYGGLFTLTEIGLDRNTGSIGPLYVGDVWVLSGQSNREGMGEMTSASRPDPSVSTFGMDGLWAPAQDPLHWRFDSRYAAYSDEP